MLFQKDVLLLLLPKNRQPDFKDVINNSIIHHSKIHLVPGIKEAIFKRNQNRVLRSGVRFTKVFRTELGHKYILVECSVIPLCLPVVSKLSRYKLVCYK